MCNPPPSISEDDLTEYEREKLAELRTKLGEKLLKETPLFNDTFSLLRWLKAWNYKIVDEIIPRFKRASSLFHCMGVNQLPLIGDVDELNEFVRSLLPIGDYVPGGVLGHDREGNIVTFQLFGNFHFKQLDKCSRNSDAFRMTIVETALVYKLLLNEERKRGRKLGICAIADVEGCNSEHLSAFSRGRPLMQTMQDLFPDILHKGYTIKTHPVIKTAFNMIKRWLPEQSRDKIVLLDSDYHAYLVNDIGAENLIPKLGGTLKPARGHPQFGTLRLGGLPPDILRYSPSSNPLHIEDNKLEKLPLPAKQMRKIKVNVPAHQSSAYLLHWFWRCQTDIGFAVINEHDNEVWPMLRLHTDRVPEYGTVPVEAGKQYTLVFDNSFSMFTKKEVMYAFRLDKAADNDDDN